MKKKLVVFLLVICITLSLLGTVYAAGDSGGICILYTGDVHCAVDDNIGYAGIAAYKAEMESDYGQNNVSLVDAGDAVQGAAIGTLSKGEYPVEIMNKVGYDVVTLGNHEFDYGMDRLFELMKMQNAAVVSCNFKSLETGATVFKPYTLIGYGDIRIAYVGITTPESFTSSSPKYFQDNEGNYIYSLCRDQTGGALYAAVQDSVDNAVTAGADYVIAVGHCGVGDFLRPWQSTDIIANTTGIDVFIDGHSHSTIAGETYKNKDGENVILTSTGTKLTAIGKLIISESGAITTELVTGYTERDESTEACIKAIQAKNEKLLNTVVAKAKVPLVINSPATGKRLIRSSETNLGDLVADAYRVLLDADIAVVNGGGIRDDIAAGNITYNNIISVQPFGNTACVVEATGQEILDLLEMGARNMPEESGGFQQVSGLTYEINTYVKSSVALDDKGNFVKVDGEYRVANVMVGGETLDLDKKYTVASHNFLIKNGGDGLVMFMDNTLLKNEVMIDNQLLTNYIVDELGGIVGDEYGDINGQGRIKVLETPFSDVAPGAWYSNYVGYAYREVIVAGTSDTAFSPDSAISRAMFVTMLYAKHFFR